MKKFLAMALAACMMVSMVACGGAKTEAPADQKPADGANTEAPAGKKDPKDMTIGVALKTLSSEYWQYVNAGAQAAAKELGCKVSVVGPNAESDIMGQVGQIEDLISQNVDAICVAPCEPNAAATALVAAKDKGIPVLFVDTDADFEGKASFLGTGNEAAAKIGADHIAKVVGKGGKAVIIRGRLGDLTHDQRTAGYEAGLKEGGLELLDTQPGDSTADRGMAVMEDFIQKYEKIDAVLCTNDDMALGAQRACEQNGRKDVKIIGFDGNVTAVDATLAGKMEGSVAQQPYNMGYMGVENAVKVAQGETIESRIDTGAKMITKENGEEYKAELQKMLGK